MVDKRGRATALARQVTVGVVTALPEEHAAVLAMLEHSVHWSAKGRGAGRAYDLGEIRARDGGRHVVALALAGMGNNSAASRGALFTAHFEELEVILMVGIAGGLPHPKKPSEHVRLGDVVVSDRQGVIQYDFFKKTGRITERRFSPRPPHARLLEAAKLLESGAISGAAPWQEHVKRAGTCRGVSRPSEAADVLIASKAPFQEVKHPDDPQRVEGQPRIFFGPIASANILLKDPVWRDRLRDQHGVKAVEMEASGIADATWQAGLGYFVVRGICDYCDGKKNDDWHMYAAVVAAAYTRALLERLTSRVGNEAGGAGDRTGSADGSDGGPRFVMRQTLWDVRMALTLLLQDAIGRLNREIVARKLPTDEVRCEPLELAYKLVSDRKLAVALVNGAAEQPLDLGPRPMSPPQLDGLLATFAQIDLPPTDPGRSLMHPLSVYHVAYFQTDQGWREGGALTIESWFRFVYRSTLLCAMFERIRMFHKRKVRGPSEVKSYAHDVRELIKAWNKSFDPETLLGHRLQAWLRS